MQDPYIIINNGSSHQRSEHLVGSQPDFQDDALAGLTIKDAAAFQTFMGFVSQGEAKEIIARDEEMFMDRGKMAAVVVGETVATAGERMKRGPLRYIRFE